MLVDVLLAMASETSTMWAIGSLIYYYKTTTKLLSTIIHFDVDSLSISKLFIFFIVEAIVQAVAPKEQSQSLLRQLNSYAANIPDKAEVPNLFIVCGHVSGI